MLKSFYQEKIYEAGCDEVGRGCLAGPVIAAAVILPKNYKNNNIKDSKKISVKKRKLLEIEIKNNAIDWSIGIVNNKKIDKINILNASILAMHNAIKKLKIKPNYLIIDGNKFKPYKKVKHTCIIQGDNKYLSIAAASIIAKIHRDRLMTILSKKFTQFTWNKNAGYGTKQHLKELISHGPTIYHRKSFEPIKSLIHNK